MLLIRVSQSTHRDCKRQKTVDGGQTKFARIFFSLPQNDRFNWQISGYKLLKLGHRASCSRSKWCASKKRSSPDISGPKL